MRSMRVGEPAIINRLNLAAFGFFNVAAVADPLGAQRRKSSRDIAVKIGITPWTAGVVNAHRLLHLNLAAHRFRRRECDFAKRHANVRINFARDVNLARIRKTVVPTWREGRGLFTVALNAGVTDPGYSFVSIRVHP